MTAQSELVVAIFYRPWNVQRFVVCLVAQYQHVDWMKLQQIPSPLNSHNQYELNII